MESLTKIKICGLSRPADIEAVNRLKPDYVGFVFVEGSKRYVTAEQARALIAGLDPAIQAVGVFQDAPPALVAELARELPLSLVQLHGREGLVYLKTLRRFRGMAAPIIKALPVGGAGMDLPSPAAYQAAGVDYLLFDSPRGGSGRSFDWHQLPDPAGLPFFLAGGLNPANVEQAVQQVRPFALDVSSGVETAGVKDARKIAELIGKVREV